MPLLFLPVFTSLFYFLRLNKNLRRRVLGQTLIMRNALYFICVTIIASIIAISSCSKKKESAAPDCSNTPRTFAADANPIFQTYCNQAACHDAGSSNGVGPLTNYSQIFPNRFAIRDAVAAGTMPQNTTLSTAQRNIILCWIDSGAPDN